MARVTPFLYLELTSQPAAAYGTGRVPDPELVIDFVSTFRRKGSAP